MYVTKWNRGQEIGVPGLITLNEGKMGKKKSDNSLSLIIEGNRITSYRFSKCVNTFFELLNDVAQSVSGKKRAIDFLVSVKPGSIVLCVKPEATNGSATDVKQTISTLKNGIDAISKRTRPPREFSENAQRKLYELGNVASIKQEDIDHVKLKINRVTRELTPSSVSYVDDLLGTAFKAYGTVDGQLEALDLHGKLTFCVFEDISGNKVKCTFSEDIYNDVIASIRKRVSVYGLIKYKKNGALNSVDIEKLTIFPDADKLPKFKDIIGLYAE